MTKERACANTPGLTRRNILAALPVSGAALALPTIAGADPDNAILAVIEELETVQGWESSCVVLAKIHAAYLIRDALDMEIPANVAEYATLHLSDQSRRFKSYQRTVYFERDQTRHKTKSLEAIS